MGLTEWLTRRAVRGMGDEIAIHVQDTLRLIPDSNQTESKFRDDAAEFFREIGNDLIIKREAGLNGTRIDLKLHMFEHDFLITIKKGLSAQKIKIVMGEIVDYFNYWTPTVKGNKTYVFLFVFGTKHKKELDALDSFIRFAERENKQRKDFCIDFALAAGVGTAGEER